MDAAEQLSVSHPRLSRQDFYEMKQRSENIDYYNAKRLNMYHKSGPLAGELLDNHKALMMSNSQHFGNVGVNTSVSAVHVPTNVYDGGNCRNAMFIYVLRQNKPMNAILSLSLAVKKVAIPS